MPNDLLGDIFDLIGATIRLSASCAAALSEAGLMPAARAEECAREMRLIAELRDARGDPDEPPSALAGQLHALARLIEDRAR